MAEEQEQQEPRSLTESASQAEAEADISNQEQEGFQLEEGAETEQEFESESEGSEQTPVNQEAVNKRINELTFEKHEERRKREALEARIAELEKTKAPAEKEVVIPPVPDPYDPQYQTLVEERDKAIAAKARQDADKQAQAEAEVQAEKDRQAATNASIQEQSVAMYKKGAEAGIKEADLLQADKTVATFIKDPSLAAFILRQENAALLITHLASNVQELEKISRMGIADGAVHITTQVLPKVGESAPKTPGAPDPLKVPKGKGGGEAQSPYLKGVTFE